MKKYFMPLVMLLVLVMLLLPLGCLSLIHI